MPTAYTPQLGLSLPTQGELSGTWGDVTNTSMTSLVDTAIAGTTTLSGDSDVTLTATVGVANQARAAIILCNGVRTIARNITAPATSKTYIVVNATTGGFSVVLRGVGPTAGVSVPAGKVMFVVWNGSDFVAAGGDASTISGVLPITNGGTGATSAAAALAALGGVGVNSPVFTGVPEAPTAAPGTSTNQLATTAFAAALGMSAALPGQTGNAGRAIATDGSTATWVGNGTPYLADAAGTTQTAVVGTQYTLRNAASTTVTLPATGTFIAGDNVWVTWLTRTDNVVARGSGNTIMGLAENMTLDTATAGTVQLRAVSATDWRIV